MSLNREKIMHAFLSAQLPQGYRVESLAGDASFRRYHRIYADDVTYLLMDAPPDKESVAEFIQVADIMSQKINVPDIIAKDIEQGFLLLQDFGSVEFAQAILEDGRKDDLYQDALTVLISLQSIPTQVGLPDYHADKLNQEMNLFSEWFLPYVGVRLSTAQESQWYDLKSVLIAQISTHPKVIVHRDYHSRNLMVDKGSKNLGVIDFQDAVIGSDVYDLASLIRDAYIRESDDWVYEQIKQFYHLKNPNISLDEFTKNVNVMSMQRHLKVLGIFIRLSKRDGKDRYLQDIPKVFSDLMHTAMRLSDENTAIKAFYDWLQAEVLPAYQRKFGNKTA
ncbi:phosphotransferase [Moraxella nasovis]|uniref:aminoglycoside phosphotransferase family protein n=1 Tax=Moraxella nasovis TaxID=2904121 RepID=UPI001F60A878|nr:phosphotransferase [Moraxella nasovis]UNU73072.1 phosphotransferase [Moraxella nasovis]